jgi:hypothetical protein
MFRELNGWGLPRLCALQILLFGTAASHAQGVIGQRNVIDNLGGNSGAYTARLPDTTPVGTTITWTVFRGRGNAPLAIGTSLSGSGASAGAIAFSPPFVLGPGVAGLVTACLPSEGSATDPVSCALIRYVGVANRADINSPTGIAGQPVSPPPSYTFYDELELGDSIDRVPRSGVIVNWTTSSAGTFGSASSISGADGVASVAYTASLVTPTQLITGVPSGPVGAELLDGVSFAGIPSISIAVSAAANIRPSAQIELPATNIPAIVGQDLPIRVRAIDSDGTILRVSVAVAYTANGELVYEDTKRFGELLGGVPNGGIKNRSSTKAQSLGVDFSWPNLPLGTYSITAKAIDNRGATSDVSQQRIVTVTDVTEERGVVRILRPSRTEVAEIGKELTISARATTPAGVSVRSVKATITPLSGGVPVTQDLTVSAASNRTYEGTWKPTTEGAHGISVTATFSSGPSSKDESRFDVKPATIVKPEPEPIKAASLTVANESAIVVKPGKPVAIDVIAKDALGVAAPGQLLQWTLALKPVGVNAVIGATQPGEKRKAAGDTPDSVTSGEVTSDSNGAARIEFTAGSAVEDRTFSVFLATDRSVQKTATLRGATSATPPLTSMVVVGKSIIARANETSDVTVVAFNDSKAPIDGVPIDWFLEPAESGEITVINATTNAVGESKASFRLFPTAKGTLLKACPRGAGSSSDKCARFVLKNALTELTQPAQTLAQPVVTQSVATSRLQLSQLRTRFQQLRNEQSSGFSNGVGVSVDGGRIPLPGSSAGGGSTERDTTGDGVKGSRWGVFTMGDIDVSRSKNSLGSAQTDVIRSSGDLELSTQGLMVGVDYRLRPSVVIGAALGGLRGKATGDSTSEQRARGVSGSLFAQWFAPGQFYVNTVASYGTNAYDLSRFVDPEIGNASTTKIRIDSNTNSKQTALQIEAGYNYASQNFSVSPYLRAEHVRAAIDGINEPVTFADAIKTSNSTLRATTVAFGLQADAKFSTRNGVWIPGLRLEYLSEKQKQSVAMAELVNARLVNGTPLVTPLPVDPYDSTYGNLGLSLQWLTGIGAQPISVFFGYDTTFGKSGVSTKRFSAGVKVPL